METNSSSILHMRKGRVASTATKQLGRSHLLHEGKSILGKLGFRFLEFRAMKQMGKGHLLHEGRGILGELQGVERSPAWVVFLS
jgi:hypothetical protein